MDRVPRMTDSVFPAPAGMNRIPENAECIAEGVPRACGDEPVGRTAGFGDI